MATRRRIGVSIASTEAARRQLMQPVSCWERALTTPENIPNISFKVRRWVRTEKLQQFSDDEGGADEPLAPLPDEPEVVDGDEEMDQEDQPPNGNESGQAAATAPQEDTQPPSPRQPLLSLVENPNDAGVDTMDALDASLNPLTTESGKAVGEEGMDLDLTGLGPDGLSLEGVAELVGGPLIDQAEDPFSESS